MRQVRKKSRSRKLMWGLLVIMVIVVAIFAAIPPLIMGDMINLHVDFQTVYQAEDFGLTAAELTLLTEDGYRLSAFEVDESSPKAVIIFLSGIHNPSVTAFYGHAKMLKDHGYASILLDMRAHGNSEGDVISLGYKEPRDVQAVVDYIRAESRYADVPIVVYGLSMGGTTAINSIGQIPEIAGVISMSAYSAWEDVFAENMSASGLPVIVSQIQKPFVKLYTIIKFGLDTASTYPKRQIRNLDSRPVLIMHSTEDSQVPFGNFERIMSNAPAHVETWTREGDLHMFTTDFLHPGNDVEYANQVISFLNRHFD